MVGFSGCVHNFTIGSERIAASNRIELIDLIITRLTTSK
jgi:hypothetical protein